MGMEGGENGIWLILGGGGVIISILKVGRPIIGNLYVHIMKSKAISFSVYGACKSEHLGASGSFINVF